MKKFIAVLMVIMCIFAFSAVIASAKDPIISPEQDIVVDLDVNGGGTITPPGGTYRPGEDAIFYIDPEDGYEIDTVEIDGKPVKPKYDENSGRWYVEFKNIQENHHIAVTFKKKASGETTKVTGTVNAGKTSPDTGNEINETIVISSVTGVALIATVAVVAAKKKNRNEN